MKKLIWTNGVFDVLHPGHIALLKAAKALGDYLVVGLDFDERVRSMKGSTRPVNTWEDRKIILESIRFVDEVVGFGSDEEIKVLLELYAPDLVVDNPDWSPAKTPYLPKGMEVRKFGLIEGYSSTSIIERIRNR